MQVITAILNYVTKGRPPFTVESKARIQKEYLTGKDHPELKLYIHDNELIQGIIDKAQFGKYGIVHTVYELYGADTAGALLSVFSRLFTLFLQVNFFFFLLLRTYYLSIVLLSDLIVAIENILYCFRFMGLRVEWTTFYCLRIQICRGVEY